MGDGFVGFRDWPLSFATSARERLGIPPHLAVFLGTLRRYSGRPAVFGMLIEDARLGLPPPSRSRAGPGLH